MPKELLPIDKHTTLPTGFIFLSDIDPTIIEGHRYHSEENFLGRKFVGYFTDKIICKKSVAEKLKLINDDLKKQGYTLVIYDAYRPQEAVDDFVKWAEDIKDHKMKEYYYPTLEKADLFKIGYISKRSNHTRGGAVDISIIESGKILKEVTPIKRKLTNWDEIYFLDDGTVDMGSSLDLFHEASHHGTSLIQAEQTTMRNFLRKSMEARGFKAMQIEWWHYDEVE